jgi:hypothetical protein
MLPSSLLLNKSNPAVQSGLTGKNGSLPVRDSLDHLHESMGQSMKGSQAGLYQRRPYSISYLGSDWNSMKTMPSIRRFLNIELPNSRNQNSQMTIPSLCSLVIPIEDCQGMKWWNRLLKGKVHNSALKEEGNSAQSSRIPSMINRTILTSIVENRANQLINSMTTVVEAI